MAFRWRNCHSKGGAIFPSREELLRVPGFGPKGVSVILRARRQGKITSVSHLTKLGLRPGRAKGFILLDGKAPARQLRLF